MKSKTTTKPSKRQDGYVPIATTAEVPLGVHKVFDTESQSLVLVNCDGEYFALANECPHDGGPLGEGLVYDHEVMCPRHGARFDFRTGRVLSFPAVTDVPAYPVKVEGDKILVKLQPLS